MASGHRFGFEWTKYPSIIPLYEQQFLGWVRPLKPDDFKGKSVLDAGCGTGRNSWWPLQYGASEITAFDAEPRTVEVAQRNLGSDPRSHVFCRSIYDIDFADRFDLAMSIGVIHHLRDPRLAVTNLVRATKPGGRILIWVYGHDGFRWLKAVINAIRVVTSRLPVGLVHVLAYPFSALFYLATRLFHPFHPYLRLLRHARFWHLHSIVFDQLIPEVANYWTREETQALFDGLPVEDVQVYECNRGSWTALARKKRA